MELIWIWKMVFYKAIGPAGANIQKLNSVLFCRDIGNSNDRFWFAPPIFSKEHKVECGVTLNLMLLAPAGQGAL